MVPQHIDILTLPFTLDIEAKDLRNAVSDVPGIYLRSESQTLNTFSQKTKLKFLGPPGQYPSFIIFSSVKGENC